VQVNGLTTTGSTLTLGVGSTSATVTITPVDDTTFEGNETVTLTVASGTGYTVGTPSSATGTIADNDVAPTISVNATDASGAEAGPDTITFTLTRGASTVGSIVVNLTWTGTATYGTDYTVTPSSGSLSANGQQLTMADGVTTVTLTVTPIDDQAVESTETVILTVASGAGYLVGSPASVTGSIADNDVASLVVSDFTVTEADNKTTTISIPITLTGPLPSAVTFTISTFAGTATAGTDFQSKTSTLTIAAGSTSTVFQVVIVNDKVAEPTETFTVRITSATGAPVAKATGTVTIIDNDGALTASAEAPGGIAAAPLAASELAAAAARAEAAWLSADPTVSFAGVTFTVGDLPGLQLGSTLGRSIVVDATAAGWGWSRMDLDAVLLHELGHALGLEHADGGLMADTLAPGIFLTALPLATGIDVHFAAPIRAGKPHHRAARLLQR
jgi:hypothetical protein